MGPELGKNNNWGLHQNTTHILGKPLSTHRGPGTTTSLKEVLLSRPMRNITIFPRQVIIYLPINYICSLDKYKPDRDTRWLKTQLMQVRNTAKLKSRFCLYPTPMNSYLLIWNRSSITGASGWKCWENAGSAKKRGTCRFKFLKEIETCFQLHIPLITTKRLLKRMVPTILTNAMFYF